MHYRITCGGSALADKAHFSEDASNGGDSLLFTAFSGSICMHRYSDLRRVFEMAVSEVTQSDSVYTVCGVQMVNVQWCACVFCISACSCSISTALRIPIVPVMTRSQVGR